MQGIYNDNLKSCQGLLYNFDTFIDDQKFCNFLVLLKQ